MSDHRKYLERQMQDPESRAEHEATPAEYDASRALAAAGLPERMAQNEPAERANPPASQPIRGMDC